jgi:hypothetical protein
MINKNPMIALKNSIKNKKILIKQIQKEILLKV